MLGWLYKKLTCCFCQDDEAIIERMLTPSPALTENSSSASSSETEINTLARMRRNHRINATPRPQEL